MLILVSFMLMLRVRLERNAILVLKVGDVCIEGVFNIRQEFVNHFTEIFKEHGVDKPSMYGVVSRSLSIYDNLSLSALFSLREFDVVVA